MFSDTITRRITFSKRQLDFADYRGKQLGLNFNDYIRHLITKDIEQLSDRITNIDSSDLLRLQNALDDHKDFKFRVMKNNEEFKQLLDKFDRSKTNIESKVKQDT